MRIRYFFCALAAISAAHLALASELAQAKTKRPVALIESIENAPDAGYLSFDYVYDKDEIDLRPGGRVVLAYFDSCRVDTITGGRIKIKDDGIKVKDDGVTSSQMRQCRTETVALSKDAKEAGASVKRISPFNSEEWEEWAVSTPQPVFKWATADNPGPPQSIRIFYLDAATPQLFWEGSASSSFLVYPEGGPRFEVGMPYQAVAEFSNGDQVSAVFSIDPALEVSDGPMERLIPLD